MPPSKLTFKNEEFQCHLTCGRCTHRKPNGERCKNRVCFGTPVCWIHTIQEYGVKTKQSTIRRAGKGLFAVTPIERNEWIIPYEGQRITQRCLNLRYPGDTTAPYASEQGRAFIDSACRRGTAAIANGKFQRNGYSKPKRDHNAEIAPRRGMGLWLRSTDPIPAGREIFVYYGNEYKLDHDHTTKRRTVPDTRPC